MITQEDVQELHNWIRALCNAQTQSRYEGDSHQFYQVTEDAWAGWIESFTDLANRMEQHLAQSDIGQEYQNANSNP